MKADERKDLETNALASGATSLLDQVKTGHLASPWGYRVIGLTVSALLIGGLVWFLWSENRKGGSRLWANLEMATPSQLEEIAAASKDGLPGKVARLEQARALLGPDGIARLTASDREAQNKGIANIEKAREAFTQLAGELKKDKTLHASCLASAAEAELALVGIPKTASGDSYRGTVKAAADLYAQAAKAVGEATPAGELFTKKAAHLTANDALLTKAGLELASRALVLPSFDGSRPGEVKAPASIEPKPNLAPGEGVKAPTAPVVLPTPPAAATPTTNK